MEIISYMSYAFSMRGMSMGIKPDIIEIHWSSLTHLPDEIPVPDRFYRWMIQVPRDRVLIISSQTNGDIQWPGKVDLIGIAIMANRCKHLYWIGPYKFMIVSW